MKGETIRNLRLDAGMTQRELAEKVGCSAAAIMRYENNQRQPKEKIVEKIAAVFNVHPMELLPLDEWEATFNPEAHLAKEVTAIENIKNNYGRNAIELLEKFVELNEKGQAEALRYLEMLTEHPKYSNKFDLDDVY